MLKIIALALILSTTPSLAVITLPSAQVDWEIDEINYFSKGPATLATICNEDTCQASQSGSTGIDGNIKVTSNNLTSIGSNSKYITAILTLILVDEGYLTLETELTSLFPEYAIWDGVTVEHLLNHASGTPSYLFSKEGADRVLKNVFNWRTKIWRPEEIVALVKDRPLIFPPGSKVEYNNTNYVLLGMIAEKSTGEPLAKLLQEKIFDRVGMKDTFLDARGAAKARRIRGFLRADVPMPGWLLNLISNKVERIGDYVETTNLFDSSFVWAAGGMVSTTSDLAKLTNALFRKNLISDRLLTRMKTPRAGTVFGAPINYGLGLMVDKTPFGTSYGHGGLIPGYQVITNYYESLGIVLSVAQNMGPSQLYTVYSDLLQRLTRPEGEKRFQPDPSVEERRLEKNAQHIRIRGKVSTGEPESPFSATVFGTAVHRDGRGKTRESLSVFSALAGNSLTIRAKGALSPFDPRRSEGGSFDFTELVINPSSLTYRQELYQGKDLPMLFAYRGRYTIHPDQSESRCINEIIDQNRLTSLQIMGGDFQVGQSVKLAANIPFVKAPSTVLAPDFVEALPPVCSGN